MTFGEKIKSVRLSLNISQSELAQKTGISERSLYTYEQNGIMPRSGNLRRIASALNVSVAYLLDDEHNSARETDSDIFIANAKNKYGHKGEMEARELLCRASALFAGGELDEESKELFFQSLMEVYLHSKKEARKNFSPKKRARKQKSNL